MQKECDMDVVTMAGDEFNRKGGISGGYHDERAARLLTLERIRELGRDLKDLGKQQKGMQAKARFFYQLQLVSCLVLFVFICFQLFYCLFVFFVTKYF